MAIVQTRSLLSKGTIGRESTVGHLKSPSGIAHDETPTESAGREGQPRREGAPLRSLGRVSAVPVVIGVSFSLVTFLIYLFGVWEYPSRDDGSIVMLVAAYNVAMLLGFAVGSAARWADKDTSSLPSPKPLVKKFVKYTLMMTLVTSIPRFIIEANLYDLNLSGFAYRVQMGLLDARVSYVLSLQAPKASGVWLAVNYVCVGTSLFSFLFTPIALLYWRSLSLPWRFFAVIYWVLQVASSLSQGKNFGIFDLGIQIAVFYILARLNPLAHDRDTTPEGNLQARDSASGYLGARSLSGNQTIRPRNGRWHKLRALLIASGLILLLVNAFSRTMNSRVGEGYDRLLTVGGRLVPLDTQSLMWVYCPVSLRPLLASLSGYLSHGYMGLGLGTELPFRTTFPFGHSRFLTSNAKDILGIDLLPRTYLSRIQASYGYDQDRYWHTAYLWFANDVSFLGVVLLLLALMYLFGRAWRDSSRQGNLFALLLMAPFARFFTFISANNQVFSTPNSLIAFWVLVYLWLSSRKRYDWATSSLRQPSPSKGGTR